MQHEQLRLATVLGERTRIDHQVGSVAYGTSLVEVASELQPNFELIAGERGWQTTFTHIVAGHFTDSPYDSVLFYEAATGHAEFYFTDGHGGLAFVAAIDGWHKGWTHIVAGKFSDSPYTSLLCYDAATGQMTLYDVDGHGGLIQLTDHVESSNTWTHITTVRLATSSYTGVVLFDQSAGRGEIRECTGGGKLSLRQSSDSWRTTWTHVVGSELSGSALLFYESATGHCEIYQLTYDPGSSDPAKNDPGQLGPMVQSDSVPVATDIVGGSFGWDSTFLFYDRNRGTLDFVFLAGGTIEAVESYAARTTWDIIVPGGFWVADDADLNFRHGGFSDLLFYDRAGGETELYLHEPPQYTPSQDLAGYTWPTSARAGQSIAFFVSSHVGAYTIRVYQQSTDEVFMTDVLGLPTAPTPLPISRTAWRDGAGWPAVATLQIPADWPSGLYLARVEAPAATPLDIPFIVRAAEDATQSKILVAMNDTTYNAYNHWGGRSHYGFGSLGTFFFSAPGSGDGGLPWGYRVSMLRPRASIFPEYTDKWTHWEVPLAKWLARQNIAVEWCTLVDIQADPGLLDRYAMFVNVGHNEYVSAEMRDRVVSFINAGGNAAFFGGNNFWWRIRIEGANDLSVCYKNGAFDPDPGAQTVNWSNALACEAQGVAWSGYAFAGDPSQRTDADGLIQYEVRDSGHWVFAGTSLSDGDRFGVYGAGDRTNVGSETDKQVSESPSGFTTLARVPFKDPDSGNVTEVATMGIFSRGGTVFTASSNDWTLGLSQDGSWGPIDQITKNVFDKLSPNWAHKDLCELTGAPIASSDPAAYQFTPFPTKHAVYRDGAGAIWELWWDATNGWGAGSLTGETGAPPAAGKPAGYQFLTEPTQHVVYRGTDGNIYELWWDSANGWGIGNLTGTVGTPLAAGDPCGYAFEGTATQHVVYRGVDGHIWELWWDAANGWGGGSLTSTTGAPLAAGDPTGYVLAADSTQHVMYRAVDGHIWELWWDSANGWGAGDLTGVTGATPPAGDPSGYAFEATYTQHVVYRGIDSHIYEMWWDSANGWGAGDLCGATGAPNAAGHPCGYMFDAEGTQHVVYRDFSGHVIELWWGAASGWSAGDLTAVSGGPVAAGDPAGFAYAPRNTQHVFYRGTDGHVHELRWR
jgi:N,N-dimethylformamidase beta subunit-like protein